MEVVSIVASVLLGIAFVVAGASKLAARDAWPTQAVGLGTPFFLVGDTWLGAATGLATAVAFGAIAFVGTLPGAALLLAGRVRRQPPGEPAPVLVGPPRLDAVGGGSRD